MRAHRPRLTSRRTALLGIAVLALLLAGCAGEGLDLPAHVQDQNAMEPVGPVALEQHRLWTTVFPIAVVVFVLVQGILLYIVFRFRGNGDEPRPPEQVHGNTRLEVIWTAIPAIILVFVAVPTVQTIFSLAAEPDPVDRLDVRVIAKQYWWEFEYLDSGVVTANELHIPAGVPVFVQMEALSAVVPDPGADAERLGPVAAGVIHSFWVPRLAGKQDVVPGHVRTMWIQADEPGQRYSGQCAEFCGLSHANMRFQVVTHSPADFDSWLEGQAQPAAEPQDALTQRGHELVGQNCVVCHAITGHPADLGIRIGPDLTHFATREVFAGGIFLNEDADQIRRWVQNPQREKPGAQMAAFPGLSDEDLDAIAAYLQSLR